MHYFARCMLRTEMDVLTDLDIACTNKRRLALEVPRVDRAQLPSIENELGKVDLATVDGV